MKTKEIAELSVDELRGRKRELRHEIFNLRLQQQSGQLEKPSSSVFCAARPRGSKPSSRRKSK